MTEQLEKTLKAALEDEQKARTAYNLEAKNGEFGARKLKRTLLRAEEARKVAAAEYKEAFDSIGEELKDEQIKDVWARPIEEEKPKKTVKKKRSSNGRSKKAPIGV